MRAFAVLSALVLSSISWTGTDAVYKLQNDSRPISYIIHLEPNMMENNFNGSVIIDFTVTMLTQPLIINQENLVVESVEIEGIPIKSWVTDEGRDTLIIYCKTDLLEGHVYRMKIKYKGEFGEWGRGLLKSSYTIGNETRWIAATYFEPFGARSVFPSWDEPIYKAVFDISIRHLSNYTTVISNMPIVNKTYHADGTITTYFNRSMVMSTYLVAFIISDYAYKSHDDNRLKVYTKPDSVHKTELAYNASMGAMRMMDEYTEIPYFQMNPKMDQVTVKDLNANGMENWGIITYSEDSLFYEEGVSTILDKEKVTTTIAHEFAHQWFGNLVSPKGWEFIWLNEGFASYFQFLITHKLNPSWRYMDLFPVKSMQWGAFRRDGRNITRPVHRDPPDPNRISAHFDVISYQKAGCILRMLSHILTEEVFHTGLKNYLRNNSYSHVDLENLVKHLQYAAGQNTTWGGASLTEIVSNWIMEQGFPLVSVKKISPGRYSLTQKKFLYHTSLVYMIVHGNKDKKKWWIPITYTTNHDLNFTDTTVTHWLTPNVNHSTIWEPETDWILLNKQQIGYYRVNYDDDLWQKLGEYLRSSNMHLIHPVNRAQLIDDALTMAFSNNTKYENALSLTLYLNREIDYVPWMTTFSNLNYLLTYVAPSKHYNLFKLYIRYIMRGLTENVRYVASPDDDFPTKVLKDSAMKMACQVNVKECLDEAHKEFNAWLKNPRHRLDPNLKNTILCTGLRTASEAVWNEVQNNLLEETFDRDGISSPLEVLGCSNNRSILHKFLIDSGQKDGNIRFTNAARGVLSNTDIAGVKIILDIFEKEIKSIWNMNNFDYHISSTSILMSSYITNDNDFMRLATFLVTRKAKSSVVGRVVGQSIRNGDWIAAYGPKIDEWLLKHEELFKSRGTEKTFMSLLLIFTIFNTMIFKIFLSI